LSFAAQTMGCLKSVQQQLQQQPGELSCRSWQHAGPEWLVESGQPTAVNWKRLKDTRKQGTILNEQAHPFARTGKGRVHRVVRQDLAVNAVIGGGGDRTHHLREPARSSSVHTAGRRSASYRQVTCCMTGHVAGAAWPLLMIAAGLRPSAASRAHRQSLCRALYHFRSARLSWPGIASNG
jgi:hypothetical protein